METVLEGAAAPKRFVRAVLFSKFPERFLRQRILPNLELHGVQVVRIEPIKAASHVTCGDDIDAVFLMHEWAGRTEGDVAVHALDGKPRFLLSRKASFWPADYRELVPVSEARDEGAPALWSMVEPFLRDFVAQWEAGASLDEIAGELRERAAALGADVRTPAALNTFLHRFVRSGEPLWFRRWWYDGRIVNRAPAVAPKAFLPPSRPTVSPLSLVPPAPPSAPASEPVSTVRLVVEPATEHDVHFVGPMSDWRKKVMGRSIEDEDVEAFCKDYKKAWDAGARGDALVPAVSPHFKGTIKLRNYLQLYQIVRHLVGEAPNAKARASAAFIEWWKEARLKTVDKGTKTSKPRGRPPGAKAKANGHLNGSAAIGAEPKVVISAIELLRNEKLLTPEAAFGMLAHYASSKTIS